MSADGKWEVTLQTPMGAQKVTMELATDGSTLTGQLVSIMGTVEVLDGTVEDDHLKWKAQMTSPMPMTLEFTATVDGDAISGEAVLGAFGKAPFSGNRV